MGRLETSICALALAWRLQAGAGNAFAQPHSLVIEIAPTFGGAPLVFDTVTNQTAARQEISVTRLDLLVSNPALRGADGTWTTFDDFQAYLSLREGRTRFELPKFSATRFTALRFLVGLTSEVNHRNPANYPAEHPLNPAVNGLHWGWQGGYVFFALEGNRDDRNTNRGYAFHLAHIPQTILLELPAPLEPGSSSVLHLTLDVARLFSEKGSVVLADQNSSTHSRTNDPVAARLRAALGDAFAIRGADVFAVSEAMPPAHFLMAADATPFPLVISSQFPRPSLPVDNPLTREGVALGRALFNDPRLSRNNRQSCASCHKLDAAGADPGRAFSLGSESQPGTRNSMPLFNLAWKSSFFWDGRAATLREQVLGPIQNPLEMHESLADVVIKLREAATGEPDGAESFRRAFGSPEINADRLARALEQFLLVQVSHDSKFDRVLKGEAAFTDAEARGFELFNTEYDPRQEQFGADCFHCHGGPLLQSAAFANNGLDAVFKDLGRFKVTQRPGDEGKFAVPSLRNVSVTGPYMHDGRFQTLEQVVEHYSSGVKRSPTLDPNLSKHPDGGVPLSAADKAALVAFLHTLTDSRFSSQSEELAGNH